MKKEIRSLSIERGLPRRVLSSALALQIFASSAVPAWAQRRGAGSDPEANPQFQQQVQSASGENGGPLGGERETAVGNNANIVSEEPYAAPSTISGVQIGATQASRSAASSLATPLDARVTVRVKNAPLSTFLDTISAQAKVNFIITEGLEAKRVTAFLQNVSVREALQVLLEIKGLTYQQIGRSNTYVVTPRSKAIDNFITRIYTLSYIPLISIGSDSSSRQGSSSANQQSSFGGAVGGNPSEGGNARAGEGSFGGGNSKDSEVAIINVITSILSPKGQVAIEPRTNALIVTDIPEVFPQVEQIIAELDKKAPQVMIEAQIVEIDSNRTKDLGIEWGGAHGELASFTAGQRETGFPQRLASDLSATRFFDPVVGVVSSVGSASAGGATIGVGQALYKTSLLDLTQLQVTLRALVSRSEARFLGKPKILTLNNKSANIQIATLQAVSTKAEQTSSNGSTLTTVSVERILTGLILKVTPQVNKEGYITMLVEPSFTDAQESSLSTASNKVFDPIKREAKTLVRVKNGQTLVMGGLLQSTESKVVRKVPFFGYIPLIGWLFTSTSTGRKNSDLVLFITPTIVND